MCNISGDITNFLLTGSYSAPDQGSEEGKPYLAAQATGQVRILLLVWRSFSVVALWRLLRISSQVPRLLLQILRLKSVVPGSFIDNKE